MRSERSKEILAEAKKKFPDLYGGIYDLGHEEGYAKALKIHKPGLKKELQTFESVQKDRDADDPGSQLSAVKLWEADADLRDEFGGDRDSWLAYHRAEQNGQIKRLGGTVKSYRRED